MSRKKIRDVYHSVYLQRRSPGSLSCGESRRRRAIQDILSSLQTHLQRWMYSAEAKDLGVRQPYGLPTRKPWRVPKPSRVTWRDSTVNIEEGHRSAARAEVDLGLNQEVDIETSLETGLETTLGPI